MKLFGWTIESPAARRQRETRALIREGWHRRTDPNLRDLMRELRSANRTIGRELKKIREAMLCPSIHAPEGSPAIRCVLQRGHIQDHSASGTTWTDAQTTAEVVS